LAALSLTPPLSINSWRRAYKLWRYNCSEGGNEIKSSKIPHCRNSPKFNRKIGRNCEKCDILTQTIPIDDVHSFVFI
jgi:hypothetical protein